MTVEQIEKEIAEIHLRVVKLHDTLCLEANATGKPAIGISRFNALRDVAATFQRLENMRLNPFG